MNPQVPDDAATFRGATGLMLGLLQRSAAMARSARRAARAACLALGVMGAVAGAAAEPSGEAGGRHGWRAVERGDYRNALHIFRRASAAAPRDPSLLLGLGLASHLVGRSDQAIAALERAIHFDSSVQQAHVLLGDLYARRAEVERAIHHYQVASALEPGDVETQARLQRARLAYRAELSYDRLFSAHFVLYFQPSLLASVSLHELADRLEETYRDVGVALASFPDGPFEVMVYHGPEFWTRTNSPAWVRGLYDGAIHLRVVPEEPQAGISAELLRHEFAHALVDRVSAGRAPVWLNEGLALYIERHGEPFGEDRPDAGEGLGPSAVPLHAEFVTLSPVDAGIAYAHSYRATTRLIREYGLERVRALLEEVAYSGTFSRAFVTVFHSDYRDFERAWLSPAR